MIARIFLEWPIIADRLFLLPKIKERRCSHGVKKEERETIIVFNEADGEASIYTFNTDLKKRLSAFAKRFPQLARLDRVFPEGAVEYVIDKDRLSIRFTAPYSEERRKAASEYARQHSKLVVG